MIIGLVLGASAALRSPRRSRRAAHSPRHCVILRGVAFGEVGRDRLLASCGIAGPVLFTAAWVASSLLQTGHSAGSVQLSGLAAMDARDPEIMMAGFVGLGACSVAFAAALRRLPAAGRA